MSQDEHKKPIYRKVEFAMAIGLKSCLTILAATSVFLVYNSTSGFVEKHITNIVLQAFVNTAITFIAYVVIDYLLEILLDFIPGEIFDGTWKKKDKSERFLLKIMTGFAFALLLSTSTMSVWSSGVMADVAVKAPETKDLTKSINNQNITYSKTLESIDKDIEKARSTEYSRVKKAKRNGHKQVKKAFNSGNHYQKDAWIQKRAWMETAKHRRYPSNKTYVQKILKAEKDSTDAVNKEKSVLAQLEQSKLLLITKGSQSRDSTIHGLTGIASIRESNYRNKFYTYQTVFIWIEIGCGILALVLACLIPLFRKNYGQQVEVKGGGLVALMVNIGSTLKNSVEQIFNSVLKAVYQQFPAVATVEVFNPQQNVNTQQSDENNQQSQQNGSEDVHTGFSRTKEALDVLESAVKKDKSNLQTYRGYLNKINKGQDIGRKRETVENAIKRYEKKYQQSKNILESAKNE